MKTLCPICFAIKNNSDKLKIKYYDEILLEEQDFAVMPAIGPINIGHVMIISKKHYINLASMGRDHIEKYELFLKSIKNKYNIYRENLLEAEHGPTQYLNAGGCVAHTHIHLIPDYGDHDEILEGKIKKIMTSCNLEEIGKLNVPYIFLRGISGKVKVYDASIVPSQYIRRVLFKNENSDKWDWALFPNDNIIKETIKYWKG